MLGLAAATAVMPACHAKIETGEPGTGDGHAADDVRATGDSQPEVLSVAPLPDSVAVVITELMYHPVLEESDVENHEFVEIYNRGRAPVSLGGWKLASDKDGIAFSFPMGTTIAQGQYLVIAKNRDMLARVAGYGLQPQGVLGDYAGELPNGGATVRLEDAAGQIVDVVKYNDRLPWPLSPDALGVGEAWLSAADLPLARHQYRGRSLERISTDIASASPANWEASALDGATPGKANSVAGTVLPIVEEIQAVPEGGSGAIIRKDQRVAVSARFSVFAGAENLNHAVSDVVVEYFVDDVTRDSVPPEPPVPMTVGLDGTYQAVLPAQADSSVVRYRIKAMRGGQNGVVAPRATDPLQWFGYFVTPRVYVKPGVETKEPTYHLFIRPSDWTNLEKWLSVGRETGEKLCDVAPSWDALVPGTFVFEGKVYDARVRYEGSRSQRYRGGMIASWKYPGPTISRPAGAAFGDNLVALSWRIKFPRYDRFAGKRSGLSFNKLSQGCPGTVSYVEGKVLEKAGIPAYQYDFGRLYINGGYYHYMGLPEDLDDTFLQRVYPAETEIGELYKSDGSFGEGISGRGDLAPIAVNPTCPKYSALDRYRYTYPRQNYTYRSHSELIKLINDLAAARAQGKPAVRTYFMKYWDWQSLLAIYAIRNWAGAWDDALHNFFPYKQPSTGKWTNIPQDFEWDFGLGRTAYYWSDSPFDPNETIYLG